MREDAYELWINKILLVIVYLILRLKIQLNTAKDIDFDEPESYEQFNKNAKTLFLDSNLELVYIVEKNQGMGFFF